MKSVKMLLAAAVLSLGTAACQMPIEDEDALLEDDAQALSATDSETGGTSCVAQFRGEGYPSGAHGLVLGWFDDCLARDMRLHVVLATNHELFEDSVQTAYGELFSAGDFAWAAEATLTKQDESHFSVLVNLLDGGMGGGAIHGDIAIDADYVAIDGTVEWD